MKVIDSSALAKLAVKGKNRMAVAKVWRAERISLGLAAKETGDALWKGVRRKQLDAKVARERLSEFVRLRPYLFANQADLYASAFEIAIASQLPFQDALFVALARERGL